MCINISTKMVTLIGTPLGQSFAARMQNAGYQAADLNMCYFYTETDSAHLKEIIDGIRYMPSFIGCAVTKPNKVAVLQYLDALDPLCAKMGACNTVVKQQDGTLKGYNTDGIGFYISLKEEANFDIAGKRFFCFGAGGAGRAICSVLAYYGAEKIYVSDIYEPDGRVLVEDLYQNFAQSAEFVPYGNYDAIQYCDMIINASGVGFGKTVGDTPLPEEFILPEKFYFDAAYNPEKTQFLINAEKKGCRILNGLGMSLYQGAHQIELWTGTKAPIEAMREELLRILAEK